MVELPTKEDISIDPADDFVTKPAFITPPIKMKATIKLLSVSQKATKIPKNTIIHKVGDLITSTIAKVSHPDYKNPRIGAGSIIFDLVVENPKEQSSKLFNKNSIYVNMKWCATEPGHTLIMSVNKSVKRDT